MPDSITNGTFNISGVSLAFNPINFEEYYVIFVKQTLSNSLVKREIYVYDFEDPNEPIIVQKHSPIPDFITNVDEKYWITAIVECEENKGIIFVKYNNEGYHCYFNSKTKSVCFKSISFIDFFQTFFFIQVFGRKFDRNSTLIWLSSKFKWNYTSTPYSKL
jgi:hypothetical protein